MAWADRDPHRRSGLSALPTRARLTRLVGVAVLLCVAGCARHRAPAIPQSRTPVAFAVVTWNMHAGKGDLAALVSDLVSGQLGGVPIREYVLLLQEAVQCGSTDRCGAPHADSDRSTTLDVEAFARAQMVHVFYSPVRPTRGGASGNAMVATRPLIDAHAIDLPRVRQPRSAIVSRIEIGGLTLFLLDAHLENRVSWLRGGLFSDRPRGRQVEALLHAVPASGAAIVGGDLNTWLGTSEPAWRRLAARFPDTIEAAEPTFRDRLKLDHLFYDLPEGWTATQFVARNSYGSDHHPVVALVVKASGVRRAP